MVKANCLFCCPSRSLPHAEHHGPSVDFPQGCFLFFFFLFCHRFFAMLIFFPVDDSCNPIWCLMPAADVLHNSSESVSLSLFLPSVSLSPHLFFQISFGIVVCLRTIKSCTMEIWKRAPKAKCPTTLCRTNVSVAWNDWSSLPTIVTHCIFYCTYCDLGSQYLFKYAFSTVSILAEGVHSPKTQDGQW